MMMIIIIISIVSPRLLLNRLPGFTRFPIKRDFARFIVLSSRRKVPFKSRILLSAPVRNTICKPATLPVSFKLDTRCTLRPSGFHAEKIFLVSTNTYLFVRFYLEKKNRGKIFWIFLNRCKEFTRDDSQSWNEVIPYDVNFFRSSTRIASRNLI